MSRVTVLGGTGYAGAAIARVAAERGHEVVTVSRTAPAEPVAGVRHLAGSATDEAVLREAITGADVVVASLAPRGELAGLLRGVYRDVARIAAEHGARLIVVGGFSTLRPAPGAPRFVEGDGVPEAFAAEAAEVAAVLDDLAATPDSLDWAFVSPAASFGSYVPAEATGRYRIGGEIAQDDGGAPLPVDDFAAAILDLAESESLGRAHRSVVVG